MSAYRSITAIAGVINTTKYYMYDWKFTLCYDSNNSPVYRRCPVRLRPRWFMSDGVLWARQTSHCPSVTTQIFLQHTADVLRAVRTRAGLVTRIATDVRNGVGLAKTRVSGGE